MLECNKKVTIFDLFVWKIVNMTTFRVDYLYNLNLTSIELKLCILYISKFLGCVIFFVTVFSNLKLIKFSQKGHSEPKVLLSPERRYHWHKCQFSLCQSLCRGGVTGGVQGTRAPPGFLEERTKECLKCSPHLTFMLLCIPRLWHFAPSLLCRETSS